MGSVTHLSVRRRLAVGGGVLALAVLLVAPAFACSPVTRVVANPSAGVPGSTFEISGVGSGGAGNLVRIEWVDGAGTVTPMGTVLTKADGTFSRQVQVPEAAVGTYSIVVAQRKADSLQWAEPGRVAFSVTSPEPATQGEPPIRLPDQLPSEPVVETTGQPATEATPQAGPAPTSTEATAAAPARTAPSVAAPVTDEQTAAPAPSPVAAAPAPTPSAEPVAPAASPKSLTSDLWSGFTGDSSLRSRATPASGEQPGSSTALGLALVTLGTLSIAGVGLVAFRRRLAYAKQS